MRTCLPLLSLALLATPALAGPADVNAQEFYIDAKALMAKGVTAMFDKRTKPRVAQMRDAGERAKAANDAATRRGEPIYCASAAERKKGMGAQQAVDMLGRVPEAQRRRSTLAQAWMAALKREYPCS